MSNSNIISPLTNNNNCILEREIDPKVLIKEYWNQYQIDTRHFFRNVDNVSIYKCLDTGYRFYYPFSLSGDDHFYRHFGKFGWYYLPWKWEHEECLRHIKEGDKVLEVGAGNGNFLEEIQRLRIAPGVGLELNSDAVHEAKSRGVRLINQTVEDHVQETSMAYDVVCAFQVLEHNSNVGKMIEAMLACLKPGGKLVISVPNNDGFLKDNILPRGVLNMPPHHMGLWNEASLKGLCKIFPLSVDEIKIEPLQETHYDTYQFILVRRFFLNFNLLIRAYWKLKMYILFRPIIKLFSTRITGHSILAVFIKKN